MAEDTGRSLRIADPCGVLVAVSCLVLIPVGGGWFIAREVLSLIGDVHWMFRGVVWFTFGIVLFWLVGAYLFFHIFDDRHRVGRWFRGGPPPIDPATGLPRYRFDRPPPKWPWRMVSHWNE